MMIMVSEGDTVLSETAYEQILQMILRQEIRCGEKIPEEKITQMLGMSRTPIREAIRRLANEGIVNLYPKRHAEVISFDEKAIKDVGLLRIALDTLAARLAILHGSNADFSQLKAIADACYQAARSGDLYRRIKLDCDFHLYMTEISGNQILLKVQKELYLKVQLIQAIKYTGIEESLKRVEGHFSILDGLFSRDEDIVVQSVYNHLASFYQIEATPSIYRQLSTVN